MGEIKKTPRFIAAIMVTVRSDLRLRDCKRSV
jgi:hypothetical protein